MNTQDTAPPKRLFTFASGGWVLVLSGIIALVILAVILVPVFRDAAQRPPGDGEDPASYGFQLEPLLVARNLIAAGHFHRDVVKPLDDPPIMAGAEVQAFNAEHRGKYLVPGDRVIGVVIDGEARAYPLVLLTFHEIANDTLGGLPISVTYNPLCDSAVVFDRNVKGEVLAFGVSGLLYNSNLLMYDRRADMQDESLWCQLQARAVAGPAVEEGLELETISAALTQWSDWLQAHPDTTVLAVDPNALRTYHDTSYSGYLQTEQLMFPVEPLPPTEKWPLKTPCVIVSAGEEQRVYPVPSLLEAAAGESIYRATLGGQELEFVLGEDPATARVMKVDDGAPADAVYSFWFAWYAMHPDCVLADAADR